MNATTRSTISKLDAARNEMPFEQWRANYKQRAGEGVVEVLGVILSSSSLATNRWTYTWRKSYLNSANQFLDAGATEQHYTGTALNINEGSNSATVVCPGILTANIPTGWAVKPIVTGSFHMFRGYRNTDGGFLWLFSCPNAVDGSCP